VVKVLFVCLGNICRSPSAEGVFRHLVDGAGLGDRILVDSAGTSDWNVGRSPDPRAQAATRRRGVDIASIRARQVTVEDLRRFDYVLAMDAANLFALTAMCPADAGCGVHMLLDFAPDAGRRDVPDPYYDGPAAFEAMLDLIELGAAGLLRHICDRHFTSGAGRPPGEAR
jgi:Protein-tyrosine-phosphatase